MTDLTKAIKLAEAASEQLQKSHVKAHERILSNGTRVQVSEHDDNRKSGLTQHEAKQHVRAMLADHAKRGYKLVDEQHDADGISVDKDKAEHSHYFLHDDKGNKATVYSHQSVDGKSHTVGSSKDGSVPKHAMGTKYLQMPEEWMLKSHVKQYTRSDGTVVNEHDGNWIGFDKAAKLHKVE